MSDDGIGEPQYRDAIEMMKKRPEQMGLMSGWSWHDDPKRVVFYLSRYKFVAKMLEGAGHVLEVGCGDGFGTRIVVQAVKQVTAVDFDPDFVQSAKETMSPQWQFACLQHDVTVRPVQGEFDAVFCLDVLEHVLPESEGRFMANMIAPLKPKGVAIIGTPSLQSQAYASAHSRQGHVNCKDQQDLKRLMQGYFDHVFVFSMNDEVVHTGHHAMAHYNFCLCCGKK